MGTRTFGKGVFQEVLELSNGGALDITAGQYFLPAGRNLGGAGVKTGSGPEARRQAADDPKTKPDEGLDKALDVAARRRLEVAPRGRAGAGAAERRAPAAAPRSSAESFTVGVLAKRGRFMVAEPFFAAPGGAADRGRPGRRGRPGQLVLVRAAGGAGTRRSPRSSGGPTSRAT